MKKTQGSRGKIPFLERDKGLARLEGHVSVERSSMLEQLKESADTDRLSVYVNCECVAFSLRLTIFS